MFSYMAAVLFQQKVILVSFVQNWTVNKREILGKYGHI